VSQALRDVPYMGVIFVVAEASKLGFENGHPDWCNLGQGQPEVGEMAGAPPRISSVELRPEDHAYGPLGGTPELCGAVAGHYNRLYRKGKSQYGPQNVSIAQGGRLALSRTMAALAPSNVGYQLPDYTAYEDMLELHMARTTAMPVRTHEADGFRLTSAEYERAVIDSGLSSFVISNPCNPTGAVIAGDELQRFISISRDRDCTLLLDEFYSHFIYSKGQDGTWGPGSGPVSGAAYVDDVEKDPVLLFDGLTKNNRYPGWRLGWIVGPSAMVETIGRVASAMDGGPSRIAQRAALEALQPEVIDQETTAVRQVFAAKRNLMVKRLSEMGVRFAAEPASTFYVWGCLDQLPAPLNDSMTFFRRALEHKVMTVPGAFFDVNPGKRRAGPSPYTQWMRFSFGPDMDNVIMGLDRLEAMVAAAK
jgi:aspartate/methionine/tyrosine aminotransferase